MLVWFPGSAAPRPPNSLYRHVYMLRRWAGRDGGRLQNYRCATLLKRISIPLDSPYMCRIALRKHLELIISTRAVETHKFSRHFFKMLDFSAHRQGILGHRLLEVKHHSMNWVSHWVSRTQRANEESWVVLHSIFILLAPSYPVILSRSIFPCIESLPD